LFSGLGRTGGRRAILAAVDRELLEDGSTRLIDAEGALLFRRPRPGVLVMSGSGRDRGQFGDVPFRDIEAEASRFEPLDLFIDTSGLDFVDSAVVSRWTAWLRELPASVHSLGILHGADMTGVNVAVAAHLARHAGRLRVHPDRTRFEDDIHRVAPMFAGLDAPLAPAMTPARRTETADGGVILEASSARLEVRPLRVGHVVVTIEGYDRGEFGATPFDEIHRRAGAQTGWRLFLDLRSARGAAAHVADAWTRWFASQRPALEAVDVLVESRTVHVTVSYARHVSGTHHLIRVHRDQGSFEAAKGPAARTTG
jgi:hypothetical protein